jgi:hypothetical protein
MQTSATEFLDMWRAAFVDADEPTEDKDDQLFEECLRLAREEGVEVAELNEAAGGDLKGFVCEAIAARVEQIRRKEEARKAAAL